MNDKWLKIIGIPIVAMIGQRIFCWELLYEDVWLWTLNYLVGIAVTALTWEGESRIHYWFIKKYPGFAQTRKRLIWELGMIAIFAALIMLVSKTLIFSHMGKDYPLSEGLIKSVVFCYVVSAILIGIYESRYFLGEWQKNVQQTEALARAHLQSQFEALKKQLDPHFLFNSMNTLASLIHPENHAAQDYLERLSDVYRYVLETRERATVTLREELKFLSAYIYLIKVRFRDNIQVINELSSKEDEMHIPSLSLQILVENAIKHNVVAKDRPLIIKIYQEGGHIMVENNKQVKQSLGDSTKIGLQNIISRYSLLNAEPVRIVDEKDLFRVSLPLLQPTIV